MPKRTMTKDDLLILACGLEDNLCHRYCGCETDDSGKKQCIQERAGEVLRAVAGQETSYSIG